MTYRLKPWLLVAGLALAMPVSAMPLSALAAGPPECEPGRIAGLPVADEQTLWGVGANVEAVDATFANMMAADENLDGRLDGVTTNAEIYYPFNSMEHFGFRLAIVVGVDGRANCVALMPSGDSEPQPQWTPQRREWAETIAQWRFKPYLLDGKPVAVIGHIDVFEYELPERNVPMPAGDPAQVVIIQDMPDFGYHIELHGNGDAVFNSTSPYYVLGQQAYHVDPASVAQVLQAARDADFWSLRDVYPQHPRTLGNTKTSGDYVSRIEIRLGNTTKSLTDYGDRNSGMPPNSHFLAYGIRHTVDLGFWYSPSLATIEQLKTNGFDFKSETAGRFLLQITGDNRVTDETVLAVMELGAPQNAYGQYGFYDARGNLLEAALSTGRSGIAIRLIAEGTLRTGDQIDPAKVNRAFLAAIRSGKVSAVDLILPYTPSMTYPDPDDTRVQISVLFGLSDHLIPQEDAVAVVQRLLDLGADINSRAANGETLLHRIGIDDGSGLMTFLLDHGADINALDNSGNAPLVAGYSEDRALFMLEHGADPRVGKTPEALRASIGAWPRVKAWLQSHGYADVLTPSVP